MVFQSCEITLLCRLDRKINSGCETKCMSLLGSSRHILEHNIDQFLIYLGTLLQLQRLMEPNELER